MAIAAYRGHQSFGSGGSVGYTDEEWEQHAAFVEKRLDELRRDDTDSRTLCGTLDRGWVRWSSERRAKQREVVRALWLEGSKNVGRDSHAMFMGGNDSGEKLIKLTDPSCGINPHDFFVVDAFWVELAMVIRGMAPQIDGLSPMESSRLIREEACELAERLAQLAYADSCNLLYMLFTAYMPDGAGFLVERMTPIDISRRYGLPSDESRGTIRSIIIEGVQSGTDFAELIAKIVARWRERPAKAAGPASWPEVYNRAELKRDDDDLYWINVAEDLGFLTIEQTDAIFDAIASAAGAKAKDDSGDEAARDWQYFASEDADLIRIPTNSVPPRNGERYWGATGGWMTNSPGCPDWADEAGDSKRYQPLNTADINVFQQYLDHRPGGVFRIGAFWPDRSARWSVPQARERVTELERKTNDIVMYWTWQEYQSDVDELARLREFLGSA